MSKELEGDENMGFEMAVELREPRLGKFKERRESTHVGCSNHYPVHVSGFVLNAECKTIPTL